MAGGWLQFIGSLAGAGADGISRYQALQQRDFQNNLATQNQQMLQQRSDLQNQLTQRQLAALDAALTHQKVEDFTSNLQPGQSVDQSTADQGKQLGLSSLFQTQQQPEYGLSANDIQGMTQGRNPFNQLLTGMAQDQTTMGDPNAQVEQQIGSTPSTVYTGTLQQQQLAQHNQELNKIMSGLDPKDPATLARVNGYLVTHGIKPLSPDEAGMKQPPPPVFHQPIPVIGPDGKTVYGDPTQVIGQQVPQKPTATNASDQDTVNNAHDTAVGILEGDYPPVALGGMGYTKEKAALAGELNRLTKGGKYGDATPAKLLLEWTAAQRAVTSLNGQQPQRLQQAAGKAIPSLALVDQLTDNLDAVLKKTGSPALNNLVLGAANQGVYGPEAQKAATLLQQQIADVTGEIGQVIMGGYAPTDHGLELAAKNLQGNWTVPVLHAATNQARRNLGYALQAMTQTAVLGSGNNTYGRQIGLGSTPQGLQTGEQQPTVAGTGAFKGTDPDGHEYHFATQDALTKFIAAAAQQGVVIK